MNDGVGCAYYGCFSIIAVAFFVGLIVLLFSFDSFRTGFFWAIGIIIALIMIVGLIHISNEGSRR